MAYIKLPENVPGIRSLVMFRPETGIHLYKLVELLLRGPSPLTTAERELLAAYVSHKNQCKFCTESHAAAARRLFGDNASIVDEVLSDAEASGADEKLKSLLNIAAKVQILGKRVAENDIARAKAAGADDRSVHDTVLIAATFSMFNRYVDGLGTFTPTATADYIEMGKRMTENGYQFST